MRTGTRSFLYTLPPSQASSLLSRGIRRQLDRRQVLFLAGESPDRLFIVAKGHIKLCATDIEAHETVLGIRASGDLLGAVAGVLRVPHGHDAIALTPATVYSVDIRAALRQLSGSPDLALALAASIASEGQELAQLALERRSGSATSRIAARLLHLGSCLGTNRGGTLEIPLVLNQAELGLYAGTSRERASRELSRLRRAGVLSYGDGRLRIFRPDVLEKLRCGERGVAPCPSIGAGGRARSRPTSDT